MRQILLFIILAYSLCSLFKPLIIAEEIDIHGFISQGYLKTTDNNYLADTEDGTFQFNEMGINFLSSVSSNLSLGIQFFARDIGTQGNDEITIDYAFADYYFSEKIGLRVGKMKAVFNLFNDTRDKDFIRVAALLPQSVYQEVYRDALNSVKGIGLYGDIPVSFFGRLSYSLQGGILEFENGGGLADAFKDRLYKYYNWYLEVDEMTHDYCFISQVNWRLPLNNISFIDLLNVGSGFIYFNDWEMNGHIENEGANSLLRYHSEHSKNIFYFIEYVYKKLHLTYEYSFMENNGEFTLNETISLNAKTRIEGWYIMCAYRLSDTYELGIGYMEYFPFARDKSGRRPVQENRPAFLNWLYDTSVTLRADLNDNWVAKFEYHYMDGFGAHTSAENDTSELNRYWNLFVVKVSYYF